MVKCMEKGNGLWEMGKFMQVVWFWDIRKEKDLFDFQLENILKGSSKKEQKKAKERCIILMEVYMKEFGSKTKSVELESSLIKMEM